VKSNKHLLKIGDNISRIRKEKGFTLMDVWSACNIEKSNLIRIEKGRTNPTANTLYKIAETLNVSIKDFFAGV